ncbi:hypothetical protein BJV78DRAFT_1353172 [Lactifluus subvellereus]|nr:hypothetical protein BJV78DRAFT_1353172 [Lactifluus subvellereus]
MHTAIKLSDTTMCEKPRLFSHWKPSLAQVAPGPGSVHNPATLQVLHQVVQSANIRAEHPKARFSASTRLKGSVSGVALTAQLARADNSTNYTVHPTKNTVEIWQLLYHCNLSLGPRLRTVQSPQFVLEGETEVANAVSVRKASVEAVSGARSLGYVEAAATAAGRNSLWVKISYKARGQSFLKRLMPESQLVDIILEFGLEY